MPGLHDGRWYDIDGNPITVQEAEELLGDIEARRIALTVIGSREVAVSTVHLVLDHNWGEGPPLIFETMVMPDCEEMERTATKEAALAAHDRMVAQVRDEQRQRSEP